MQIKREDCDFYFIWTRTGHVPRRRHTDKQAALKEIERLTQKHPGKTFILLHGAEKFKVEAEPMKEAA